MKAFANRWVPEHGQRVIVKRTKCYRSGVVVIEQPGTIVHRVSKNSWKVVLDNGVTRDFAKQCLEWQPTIEEIYTRATYVRKLRGVQ